jgi:hypothetical protein
MAGRVTLSASIDETDTLLMATLDTALRVGKSRDRYKGLSPAASFVLPSGSQAG